jgi:phenylacetate-CoA ligase
MGAAAKAMGLNPARDFALRAIGAAGELLTPARRRRLEQMWNCQIYNYYGTTETGNLATDSQFGNLHLAWDHFLVEVIDEEAYERDGTVKVLPEGSLGMPLFTTLTREAMPLIRYLLTDLVRVEYDHNCPSGIKAPIIRPQGRDASRFPFQGRKIMLGDVEDRLFRLPAEVLGDIYMVVITPEKVYFRAECERPDPALYRQAEKLVRDELQLPLEIVPVQPGGLFPVWWLLQPARVGKPSFFWIGEALEKAPPDLPHLWMPEMFMDEKELAALGEGGGPS